MNKTENMYKKTVMFLSQNNYRFYTSYNAMAEHKEIGIATEDETQVLVMKFTLHGEFISSNYFYGGYEDFLEASIMATIRTGNFTYIHSYCGTEKVKCRF